MIKRKTVVKDNANYYITINDDLEVEVNGFADLKPVFDAENMPDAIHAMEYFEGMITEGWLEELYSSKYPLTASDLFGA